MAFTNKGAVLGSLGRYKEALELYRRAENLDPSNTVAKSKKEQLEKLMKQKRIN
jgi:tetratricopeptide (TPR) repeat protein